VACLSKALKRRYRPPRLGRQVQHAVPSLWHGRGEIGWGVDAQYIGRGFGTEIGRAMVHFGFKFGLHRLYAQWRVGNAASIRTMAKVGMTEEGIIRENVKARGEWWSSCQWSILRGDLK
jgi:RimJ/RimL family protein N-acetyltransferase